MNNKNTSRYYGSLCYVAVSFLILSAVPVFADSQDIKLAFEPNGLVVVHSGQILNISTRSPEYIFSTGTVLPLAPAKISGDILSGKPVEVSFLTTDVKDVGRLETKLIFEFSKQEQIIRKYAMFRLTGTGRDAILLEIIFDRYESNRLIEPLADTPPQSYPALFPGFFVGIEYPVASTRVEGNNLIIGHRPGLTIEPGKWYQSHTAVYGIVPPRAERADFLKYIDSHRIPPKGMHFNYCTWWTAPAPYSEQDALDIIKVLEEKLYKPYGISPDSVGLDLGWSDPNTIWEIRKKDFPNGFSNIASAVRAINSQLGLWISPSNFYTPKSVNSVWAKKAGYETVERPLPWSPKKRLLCCMGGKRYKEAFQKNLLSAIEKYDIRELKIDGYYLDCPDPNHGHQPGIYSSDAIAATGIEFFDAVHRINPNTWIAATCFGNPSPWWLFHVNSCIAEFGDDAPFGQVPSPVYRESYTTARDYYNLSGFENHILPIFAQENCGIDHQTYDPFTNDAVMVIMRGHCFFFLFVNPKYMSDAGWKTLADVIKWARANEQILKTTAALFPHQQIDDKPVPFSSNTKMPRLPYGYAHAWGQKCLVALRNPWMLPQTYTFKFDGSIGKEPDNRKYSAVSLYPEIRTYAQDISFGQDVAVNLAPYETVVLSFEPVKPAKDIVSASEAIGHSITAKVRDVNVNSFDSNSIQLALKADAEVKSPAAQLLVFLEAKALPSEPNISIAVNGKSAAIITRKSVMKFYKNIPINADKTKWRLDDVAPGEAWAAPNPIHSPPFESWRFCIAELPLGKSNIDLKLKTGSDCNNVSVWILTSRAPKASRYKNALPQPESIYTDGVQLWQKERKNAK